jgi:hypothetical protein
MLLSTRRCGFPNTRKHTPRVPSVRMHTEVQAACTRRLSAARRAHARIRPARQACAACGLVRLGPSLRAAVWCSAVRSAALLAVGLYCFVCIVCIVLCWSASAVPSTRHMPATCYLPHGTCPPHPQARRHGQRGSGGGRPGGRAAGRCGARAAADQPTEPNKHTKQPLSTVATPVAADSTHARRTDTRAPHV